MVKEEGCRGLDFRYQVKDARRVEHCGVKWCAGAGEVGGEGARSLVTGRRSFNF